MKRRGYKPTRTRTACHSENYTLEVVGRDRIGNSDCLVVTASRRREQTDLFEGKIWIDNQICGSHKITGHLAKSPSFGISRWILSGLSEVGRFLAPLERKVVSAVRIFGRRH